MACELPESVTQRLALAGVDLSQLSDVEDVRVLSEKADRSTESGGILGRSQIGWSTIHPANLGALTDRQLLVIDQERPAADVMPLLRELAAAGRVITFRPAPLRLDPPAAQVVDSADSLLAAVDAQIERDVVCEPRCEALRVRHLRGGEEHFYVFVNAGDDPIDSAIRIRERGRRFALDPTSDAEVPLGQTIRMVMPAGGSGIVRVRRDEP